MGAPTDDTRLHMSLWQSVVLMGCSARPCQVGPVDLAEASVSAGVAGQRANNTTFTTLGDNLACGCGSKYVDDACRGPYGHREASYRDGMENGQAAQRSHGFASSMVFADQGGKCVRTFRRKFVSFSEPRCAALLQVVMTFRFWS